MDIINSVLPTPAEPPNGEYSNGSSETADKQLLAKYSNNYGASIVQSRMSYGGDEGLFELAVIHWYFARFLIHPRSLKS